MDGEAVTPGRKLTRHARERADEVAVVVARADGECASLTWRALESWANRLARRLAEAGVTPGSMVAIGLPTSLEHVVATQAAWKLGACAMPLSRALPPAERDEMLQLAEPAAIIADWGDLPTITSADLAVVDEDYPDSPLAEDPCPAPFKAIASGGSTGRPKLIVSPGPFAHPDGVHPLGPLLGLADGIRCYSPGPLYHNQAFLLTAIALYQGGSVVLNERFDARRALELIDQLRVTYLNVVPTMMSRMLRAAEAAAPDLSSLQTVFHMAAPCPAWVKQGWIDLVGADRVYELWGATELTGLTVIRGDDWLAHPGSVGQPVATEIRILAEDGTELPPGEVGEIFSRMPGSSGPSYHYLGAAPLPERDGGFVSVGDLGHLDEEGYLYLDDRRTDLIITGGSNVYPAEVEEALSSHPDVADVVVIGLPDDDLGMRVHALVQPRETRLPTQESLDAHVQGRISRYKAPRSYEIVPRLPRGEHGKIRRRALRDERVGDA